MCRAGRPIPDMFDAQSTGVLAAIALTQPRRHDHREGGYLVTQPRVRARARDSESYAFASGAPATRPHAHRDQDGGGCGQPSPPCTDMPTRRSRPKSDVSHVGR